MVYLNCGTKLLVAVFLFLFPAARVGCDVSDPAIREARVPKAAIRLHESLAPKYERWARDRVESGNAIGLSTEDIAGTEWPLFGSVFYLWAIESIQAAWERDHDIIKEEPKVYARGAIEAATALVLDPGHAAWVKWHWGEDYLNRENVF